MEDPEPEISKAETLGMKQEVEAVIVDDALEHSSTDSVDLEQYSNLGSGIIANKVPDFIHERRSRRKEAWAARLKGWERSRRSGSQSIFWPEDDFRVDIGDSDYFGLLDHLIPFVPYVEKCALSYTPDIEMETVTEQSRADIIRNWIRFCDAEHSSVCRSHVAGDRVHALAPRLLIDVQELSITRDTTGANYIALSYVWGTGESFCTTTENLEALLQPKSLEREPFVPPKTILDAIELVQEIGERYLWVDRYCIEQDNQDTKRQELHMMGSIYARSILTICAAENDSAMSGLYSVSETRQNDPINSARQPWYRRTFRQPLVHRRTRSSLIPSAPVLRQFSTNHRNRMLAHAQLLMRSTWFSRGWTFQENIFSSRKLIFHDGVAHWECLCAAWHEQQNSGDDNCFLSATTIEKAANVQLWEGGFEYSRWPSMFRFSRLVSIFNDRTLTFQEDALDAFAGILGVLGNTFEGGFLSGLPVFCFDAAMLWQPWSPMKRRTPTRSNIESCTLPSWSWVGWWGVINSESWRSAGSYATENCDNGSQTSWTTLNTVSWQYSKTLDGPKRSVNTRPLIGSPSHWEAVADANLPQGWKRQRDQQGKSTYCHPCAPGKGFAYPIPILEPSADPVTPMYASFLHGQTRRGYLQPGETYTSIASQCDAVELLTASGAWAGVLRLCHPRSEDRLAGDASAIVPEIQDRSSSGGSTEHEHLDSTIMRPLNYFDASSYYLMNPPQADTARTRGTVYPRTRHRAGPDPTERLAASQFELVEISAGSVENKDSEKVCFDEWERARCPRHSGKYEFYNVLWVEWIGQVAYRKAVGRVEKSVWEAEKKDEINLVLG